LKIISEIELSEFFRYQGRRGEDGDRGAKRILTKQKKNMHALWDQLLGDEFTLNGTRKRIVEITGDADVVAKGRFAISTSGGLDPQHWLAESRAAARHQSIAIESEALLVLSHEW
jgi:hypothetical protein